MKPTFLGLGAQKCASTWIHRVLDSHPEVSLPMEKEVDFFSHHFDYGYQWYERHFDARAADRCVGEVSPSYFHDVQAPSRVRSYCPGARLLVTLRDPIERAISNHKHEVRLGRLVGDLSFEAGLTNNPMYVEQGLYGKHLSNWLRSFPSEQICVVLVDDIRQDPAGVARRIFAFLGIDASHESPAVDQRFNSSFANRFQTLAGLKDRLYELSRRRGMAWLWSTASGIGAREAYRRLNVVDSDTVIPPVRPETLRALRERFAADVRQLECLLGRRLSGWLFSGEMDFNGEEERGDIGP